MLGISVDDAVNDRTESFILDDELRARVVARWEQVDPLLLSMQHQSFFRNVSRWSDLSAEQFQVLITLHMAVLDDAEAGARAMALRSRDDLIAGLVHCLQLRISGTISEIVLRRLDVDDIRYDLRLELKAMTMPLPRRFFKVIVDNTPKGG
jgi:hypothetical protein